MIYKTYDICPRSSSSESLSPSEAFKFSFTTNVSLLVDHISKWKRLTQNAHDILAIGDLLFDCHVSCL